VKSVVFYLASRRKNLRSISRSRTTDFTDYTYPNPEHSLTGGAGEILRSTLWTIVEQPDFKISGGRPGVVQERAAAPHVSARPYVAASDVGCTVG
jgi:hypothetical protein